MTADFHLDHGPVSWPAIVVHGGAGTYDRGDLEAAGLEAGLGAALDAGWEALSGDGDPLAAVVSAIEALEQHGGFNAGRGSVPNTAGTVEMDAGLMDDTGRAGAVACITGHAPIRAAEAVLHRGGAILLAGPHADLFAEAAHVAPLRPLRARTVASTDPTPFAGERPRHGTVGAVAVSGDGRFAAGTSTGGRGGQLPGRVGDTPIPGAGVWAQPGCAVSATGTGEAFVLAGFGRLVGDRHAAGDALPVALRTALDAVAAYHGDGGGIALGADRTWAGAFTTRAMARGVRYGPRRQVTILG